MGPWNLQNISHWKVQMVPSSESSKNPLAQRVPGTLLGPKGFHGTLEPSKYQPLDRWFQVQRVTGTLWPRGFQAPYWGLKGSMGPWNLQNISHWKVQMVPSSESYRNPLALRVPGTLCEAERVP